MSAGEIDDPTLLGYLLGSLDDAESERVEALRRGSTALRGQLVELRNRLALPAVGDDLDSDPPDGLVDRTLAAVDSRDRRVGGDVRELLKPIGLSPPAESRLTAAGFNSAAYWFELSAIAAAALVCGVIGISHVLNLQEQARRQRCAANLATLGLAIQDFAFHRRDQAAPRIDPEGLFAFAGVYSVRLKDAELLTADELLWCPSDPRLLGVGLPLDEVPTSGRLLAADREQLACWRRRSGGSYTYNLGVQIRDHYQSSRYLARPSFAVLGDAPAMRGGRLEWDSHGANRGNILFEDGGVRLVSRDGLSPWIDDPYLNDAGLMQAGLHADDAAMGPSPLGPKSDARSLELWLER